jgi:hypothetical protein
LLVATEAESDGPPGIGTGIEDEEEDGIGAEEGNIDIPIPPGGGELVDLRNRDIVIEGVGADPASLGTPELLL